MKRIQSKLTGCPGVKFLRWWWIGGQDSRPDPAAPYYYRSFLWPLSTQTQSPARFQVVKAIERRRIVSDLPNSTNSPSRDADTVLPGEARQARPVWNTSHSSLTTANPILVLNTSLTRGTVFLGCSRMSTIY